MQSIESSIIVPKSPIKSPNVENRQFLYNKSKQFQARISQEEINETYNLLSNSNQQENQSSSNLLSMETRAQEQIQIQNELDKQLIDIPRTNSNESPIRRHHQDQKPSKLLIPQIAINTINVLPPQTPTKSIQKIHQSPDPLSHSMPYQLDLRLLNKSPYQGSSRLTGRSRQGQENNNNYYLLGANQNIGRELLKSGSRLQPIKLEVVASRSKIPILQHSPLIKSKKTPLFQNEMIIQQKEQQSFNWCTLIQCQLAKRSDTPQSLMIIHIEKALGFYNTAFFGFQLIDEFSQKEITAYFTELYIDRNQKFYIYKDIKEQFKKLAKTYLIIIILSEKSPVKKQMLDHFQEHKIPVDAFYEIMSYDQNSLKFVVDYNLIVQDFNLNFIKKIIIINAIDFENLNEIVSIEKNSEKKHPLQMIEQSNRRISTHFIQDIRTLKQGLMNTEGQKLLKFLFPKIEKGDTHNLRLILFPQLTFKKIITSQNKNVSLNLERFKYVSSNVFNELGFLQMIQTHRSSILRMNFIDILEKIKSEQDSKYQQNLEKNKLQQDFYDQITQHCQEELNLEEIENFMSDQQKKIKGEFLLKFEGKMKKTAEEFDELCENLFMKRNIKILKLLLKEKKKMKETQDPRKLIINNNNQLVEEIQYCHQFSDLILLFYFNLHENQ